jgi:hypothetical protein
MPSLAEVYRRLQTAKKKQKDLRDMYKDALTHSKTYQEVKDELEKLLEKKRRIEAAVKADFVNEQAQIDRLRTSMDSDKQLLTDLALTQLMKGQEVEITEDDVSYEPIFKVNFKKKDGSTSHETSREE